MAGRPDLHNLEAHIPKRRLAAIIAKNGIERAMRLDYPFDRVGGLLPQRHDGTDRHLGRGTSYSPQVGIYRSEPKHAMSDNRPKAIFDSSLQQEPANGWGRGDIG